MNLDDQLKAALDLEAEMRAAPPPDLEGILSGGQSRRRRHHAIRTGVVAAAVVLVAGGALGATQLGSDGDSTAGPGVGHEPTGSTTTEAAGPSRLPVAGRIPPGTYRKFVGLRDEAGVIEADLTYGIRGWQPGDHPVLHLAGDWGGASVYQAERVAGRDHCSLDAQDPDRWPATSRPAAGTVEALAEQLAALPQSTVVAPVTPTRAFGYDAFHLRLRILDDCAPGVYHLVDTDTGAHGISYYDRSEEVPPVVIDFVVVDVDDAPVVAEYWHHQGADPALVAEVSAVRNSISFVTIDRHSVD